MSKRKLKKAAKAERELVHAAAAHRGHPAAKTAGLLAEVADQPELIAASVGTLVVGLATRRGDLIRGGARMLTAHLVATAAKAVVKHSFDRTRPARAMKDGRHRFEPGDSGDHELNSFPSGHTAGAVAVARAVSRDIDGAAPPLALATGAIAATQPVTGAHYLSDVVAGAVIGWASEAVVSLIFDRVEPRVEAAIRERVAT